MDTMDTEKKQAATGMFRAPSPSGEGPWRRGPLREGEQVQLTDQKGKINAIVLGRDKRFHTHRGFISHNDIIGLEDASVIKNSAGISYQVLRPLLKDFVMSMPRGAAIVYPKDAGEIIIRGDIFPGATVVEAGVGSGALSLSLLRAVGEKGMLRSFERREDFARIARANVETFFGADLPQWQLTVGDLRDALPDVQDKATVDRVVLDMLAPWECIGEVARVLVAGGVFVSYVATVTQLSRLAEALRADGRFNQPESWETMVRNWHVEGLAVRPDHRMVAHTGFIVSARRLVDGTQPLERVRRKSKTDYGLEDMQAWLPEMIGERVKSDKRIRKIVRSAEKKRNESLGVKGICGEGGPTES